MSEPKKSPRIAEWILKIMLRRNEQCEKLGDFEEGFQYERQKKGTKRAQLWYWSQTFKAIPFSVKNFVYWSLEMLKNYLKIALRHIKRHKAYSFINITGLAVGITCSVLMLMWVQDELSFDRFHQNAAELHRILLDPQEAATTHEAVSPPILARKMKEEFPEVVNATRITPHGQMLFTFEDKSFNDQRGLLADPSFFEMFDFPFIQGDPSSALTELNSIVLTQKVANKFFGDDDPLGKTITVNNNKDFTVTGVIDDVPANSHLQFDFVRPFKLFGESGRDLDSWGDVSFYTYVQLQGGASVQAVNNKLKEMVERDDPGHNMYYLQPLIRIHLHSNFNFDFASHGNVIYIYIFAAAALFILLIACINFMNLATARSAIRAKEVGMRKVIGAHKSDIIKQFYGESILSSLFSLAIAFVLILLLLPAFNNLSGKELSFSLSENTELILVLLIIGIFTGILSGSYPALFLSAFRPIAIFRGAFRSGVRGAGFRKILVVTQFSLTIILIIGTLVVHRQLSHIRGTNLGYDKEHVVVFAQRGEMRKNSDTVKTELLRNPDIFSVTFSSSLPTHIGSGTSGAWWEGKEQGIRVQMQINSVDYDYMDTMRMEMVQGRFFSRDHPSDNKAFVLNEAAVKATGMESPLGKGFRAFGIEGPIIGVIKDFHYKSLHTKIEPLILLIAPQAYYHATVRVNGENLKSALASVEESWKKFAPGFPFEFSFLDDRIDNLYRAEQRMGKVFNSFTVLAIFIACLGLFGMASFNAERRTKEIGIRKVLGASIPNILILLSKESTWLILISNIIAWPVAYLIMHQWLQNFAYRTNIELWIFFASALAALLLALLTICLQSIKAALTNPADSLRYE